LRPNTEGTGSPQTGGGAYYLSHRKEFLDVAGEWYLDQNKDELYLAVAVGETPPAELVAPVVRQLIVAEGTVRVFDRNLQSRMPLSFTPLLLCLKRWHACDKNGIALGYSLLLPVHTL
jgi:hypothetical protein